MVTGTLAATMVSRDGRETGVGLAGPGEVLPSGAGVRVWELEPSRWVAVPPQGVTGAGPRDPPVADALLDACRRSLAVATEALAVAALGSAGGRLAWWLGALADRVGRPARPGVILRVRITQDDLARLVGISRETVNRELRVLGGQGLVLRRRGRLVVTDLGALRGRADP